MRKKKSKIAIKLKKIKNSAISVSKSRDTIPKTLFWSLLSEEISVLKKEKTKNKIERDLWIAGVTKENGVLESD